MAQGCQRGQHQGGLQAGRHPGQLRDPSVRQAGWRAGRQSEVHPMKATIRQLKSELRFDLEAEAKNQEKEGQCVKWGPQEYVYLCATTKPTPSGTKYNLYRKGSAELPDCFHKRPRWEQDWIAKVLSGRGPGLASVCCGASQTPRSHQHRSQRALVELEGHVMALNAQVAQLLTERDAARAQQAITQLNLTSMARRRARLAPRRWLAARRAPRRRPRCAPRRRARDSRAPLSSPKSARTARRAMLATSRMSCGARASTAAEDQGQLCRRTGCHRPQAC